MGRFTDQDTDNVSENAIRVLNIFQFLAEPENKKCAARAMGMTEQEMFTATDELENAGLIVTRKPN